MGGHSHWKVVGGCTALKTPFFRPFLSSGDLSFQVLFQLQIPHFKFFGKNAFSSPIFADFLLNSTPDHTNFSENLFLKPSSQQKKKKKKNSSRDPTFEKLGSTCRAVASLSLPGGQNKSISSILPHFPVGSLMFLKFSSFSSSF